MIVTAKFVSLNLSRLIAAFSYIVKITLLDHTTAIKILPEKIFLMENYYNYFGEYFKHLSHLNIGL